MRLKALHEVRSLHALSVCRPVVHIGGGHELAALCDAGDEYRVEVGASGVDGGGVTGRPGAEDQYFGVFHGACPHRIQGQVV
ncbi:hypothetical protein FQZ97_950690 [compost metagenome]